MASFQSRVFLAALTAIAGCSNLRGALVDGAPADDARGPVDGALPVDATGRGDGASDAWVCTSTAVFTPVTVAGTSPGGLLDGFHYAYAEFVTGFCPTSYLVNFTADRVAPGCALVPWLQLAINMPAAGPGTHRASASLPNASQYTENVTFQATTLEPPDATAPHIVGHFVSHDPAWSFDIAVDLTSQSSTNCI